MHRLLFFCTLFLLSGLPVLAAGPSRLESYLAAKLPAEIHKISVGPTSIEITGKVPDPAKTYLIAEVPMEVKTGEASLIGNYPLRPDASGNFQISIPRFLESDPGAHDRLLSRWLILLKAPAGMKPVSHARYADEILSRTPHPPAATLKSKKGLGGWSLGRFPNELDDLGISAVTVNMMVHSLLALEPGPGLTPIRWNGKTYYTRDSVVESFDKTFFEAAKRNVMVSVILLIANPSKDTNPVVKILGHPDAKKEGIFAMPNLTSAEGISLYAAIMNFMAERWSRPDGKYGRVHHWILHNEVDAGKVWTNAGDKTDLEYMELYQRSMRLVDLISRQYDPNMRPFISLTHHWSNKGEPGWHGSENLLNLLTRFCAAEGDFPWALAYHPYPQDLTNPRTWEDTQATFSFHSPKITPKNLEVLDAFMKRPGMLYRGQVRPVHLSENGFNSRDYSEKSLADQAAGMAFAWKKIAPLTSIQVWHYHNWIDNRGEGGLRIGLHKFPDEPGDPAGKKPIWHLYQALGTPQEDSACAPSLKTIGIPSWDQAIHTGDIR